MTGTATVLVTAQDTSVSQTYTINFTVAATVLLMPVVTPDGGAISSTQQITITDPNGIPGDSVYYTLDGSMPTMQNNLYTVPFTLDNSATVAAAVYNPTPGGARQAG